MQVWTAGKAGRLCVATQKENFFLDTSPSALYDAARSNTKKLRVFFRAADAPVLCAPGKGKHA